MDNQFQVILDHTLSRVLQPRACDQCYARKVRCERTTPCTTCSEAGLICTYRRRATKKAGVRLAAQGVEPTTAARHSPLGSGKPTEQFPNDNSTLTTAHCQLQEQEISGEGSESTFTVVSPAHHIEAAGGIGDWPCAFNNDFGDVITSETPGCQIDQDRMPLEHWLRMGDFDFSSTSSSDSPPIFLPGVPMSSIGNTAPELLSTLPRLSLPHPPIPSISRIPHWPTAGQVFGSAPEDLSVSPLSAAQIYRIVDIFLSRLHMSMPFFKRAYLVDNIRRHHHEKDRQFSALLHSICAYTLYQPIFSEDAPLFTRRLDLAESVLSYGIALHGGKDFGQEPKLETVITSFFLFGCQFCRGNHNAAMLRLREAQVLAELLRLNDPSAYGSITPDEFDRRVRTMTALIIIDRIYALQRGTKLQMPRLPASVITNLQNLIHTASSPADAPDDLAVDGMRRMAESTDFVDDTVVRCWKNSCRMDPDEQHVGPETVANLLERYMRPLHPTCDTGAEAQHADILLTRYWICSMLWSLALRHEYASFSALRQELQPSYAVHIASQTAEACAGFSLSALETHGVGLAEKLYEIAVNLTQVTQAFKLNISDTNDTDGDGGSTLSGSNLDSVLSVEDAGSAHVTFTARRADWTSQLPIISLDTHKAQALHVKAILNRFLALLALFRGGDHPFLKPFVDILADMNKTDEPRLPTMEC